MIVLKNIEKTYCKGTSAQVEALKNIDLSISDGEMVDIQKLGIQADRCSRRKVY